MLSQIVASQFLALFVHDESDDTAASSMISETEVCIARISPASSRNSQGSRLRHRATRTVSCPLSLPVSSTVSWNPNLFCTTGVNKRIWRHFSPKTLCARGANDDLCITEFCTNVHLQNHPQPRFTSKNRSTSRVETSVAANNFFHDI